MRRFRIEAEGAPVAVIDRMHDVVVAITTEPGFHAQCFASCDVGYAAGKCRVICVAQHLTRIGHGHERATPIASLAAQLDGSRRCGRVHDWLRS